MSFKNKYGKKQEIGSPAYNSYNRIQRAILGFIRNSNRYEKLNEYEMYIVSSYWINIWIKSLKKKDKVTECKIINNLDEIKNLIYNDKEFKFVDDSFINNIKKPYIKSTIQPFKIYFGNNKIILDIDNNSILLIMAKEDLKHSNYYIIKCLDFGKKIEKNKKNDFIKTILYEDINKLIKNQKEKNFDISEIKKENKDIKPVISEDKLEKLKENNISNQIINNNNSQIRESIQIQESIAQNLEQTMTKSYINNHQIEESIKESIPKIQDKPMIKAEIINNQKENYIKESLPNFQEQTIIKTEYPQIIINQEKTPQKKEDLKISKNSLKKEEEKLSYYEDEKFIKSYEKKIGESLIQDLLNDDLNKLNSQNKLKSQCENDIFSITNKINEILNEIKDLNDDKQNKFKINKITASFLSYKPKNKPTEKQLKNREEFDQIYNSLKQKEKKDKINKLYKQKEILENKLKEKNIFLEEIENEIYSIKQNMYEHNNLINKSRLLEKSIKEIEKLNIINKNKDELKLLQSKLKRIEYDNTQKEMALEAKRKIEEKKKKELEDIKNTVEKNEEHLKKLLKEMENIEQNEYNLCDEFRNLESNVYEVEKELSKSNDIKLDYENKIKSFSNTNIFTEIFQISFNGKFGVINGCKFCEPNNNNLDYINGGWGYIILLTKLLAIKYKFDSVKYDLVPLGNYSKITEKEKKMDYELILYDAKLKEKFNTAMVAYLGFLEEFLNYLYKEGKIKVNSEDYCPKITGDKINNKSIRIENGKDKLEDWYQCMKFLLTILKYLILQVLIDENNAFTENIDNIDIINNSKPPNKANESKV